MHGNYSSWALETTLATTYVTMFEKTKNCCILPRYVHYCTLWSYGACQRIFFMTFGSF